MNDPKRWTDPEGGADPLERKLLAEAPNVDPPHGSRAVVWSALVAGPLAGTAVAATRAAGGSFPTWIAGALLVGAGIGGYLYFQRDALSISRGETPLELPAEAPAALPRGAPAEIAPIAPAAPPAPVEPPLAKPAADAPVVPEPAAELPAVRTTTARTPVPSPAEAAEAAPAPEDPAAIEERQSRIAEEARLLRSARQALRDGNADLALARVSEAKRRFRDGVLGQEAEAIAIEALVRSGSKREAELRLEAFEKAHPQSPHGTRLREQLE